MGSYSMRFFYLCFIFLFVFVMTFPAACFAQQEEIKPFGLFQYTGGNGASEQTISIDPLEEKALNPAGDSQTLNLTDAIRYALERNRNIEISSYSTQEAEQRFNRYSAVYDPVIFASGSLSQVDRPIQSQLDTGSILDDSLREDRWLMQLGVKSLISSGAILSLYQEVDYLDSNSSLIFPNPQSTSRLTAQLNQPLLKGIGDQENRTAIKIARLNISISNEDFKQTAMDVVANVSLAYWQLALDQQMIDIGNRYFDKMKELHRREHKRLARGIAKDLDVARVAANLDSRRTELILLSKQVKSSEKKLQLLINAPRLFDSPKRLMLDNHVLLSLDDVTFNRDEAESSAINYRPEIERARKELQVSGLRKGLAKWEKLPTLDLLANYSKNALGDEKWSAGGDVYESENESWSVGLNFELPLGNRANESQHRGAKFEYRRKVSEYKQIEEQVMFEVNQTLTDLGLAKAEVESAERAKITAMKVVDGEYALFELARADSYDLLQAHSQLDSTERKLAQSLIGVTRAKILLSRAKGTLLEDLGIIVQASDAHH